MIFAARFRVVFACDHLQIVIMYTSYVKQVWEHFYSYGNTFV